MPISFWILVTEILEVSRDQLAGRIRTLRGFAERTEVLADVHV